MKKVLLSEEISNNAVNLLKNAGFEVVLSPSTEPEVMKEQIKDADALIVRTSPVTKELMECGENLKIISRPGTGIDNVDVASATEKGILVSKVDGVNAYAVAEYILATMLTLSRRLNLSDSLFREGKLSVEDKTVPSLKTQYNLNGYEIRGKKLGILGFGKIGSMLADLAKPFGLDVVAYDPYLERASVPLVDNIEGILETCDFVSINMPLTKDTKNLFTKKELDLMKPNAYLINASRGGIVNEEDLSHALNNDVIAGAALDVFEDEPPKKGNPILTAKNTLLTCHIAGTSIESLEELANEAAQAVIDYSKGQLPKFPVNPDVFA